MRDAAMPQYAAVASQDDPPLAQSDVDDGAIVEVVTPNSVETNEPQVTRESAEVHIGDETRDAQRSRPQPQQRRDVDASNMG